LGAVVCRARGCMGFTQSREAAVGGRVSAHSNCASHRGRGGHGSPDVVGPHLRRDTDLNGTDLRAEALFPSAIAAFLRTPARTTHDHLCPLRPLCDAQFHALPNSNARLRGSNARCAVWLHRAPS
jgi:hypothetical protein